MARYKDRYKCGKIQRQIEMWQDTKIDGKVARYKDIQKGGKIQ